MFIVSSKSGSPTSWNLIQNRRVATDVEATLIVCPTCANSSNPWLPPNQIQLVPVRGAVTPRPTQRVVVQIGLSPGKRVDDCMGHNGQPGSGGGGGPISKPPSSIKFGPDKHA